MTTKTLPPAAVLLPGRTPHPAPSGTLAALGGEVQPCPRPAASDSTPSLTALLCHWTTSQPTERPCKLAPGQSASVPCCILYRHPTPRGDCGPLPTYLLLLGCRPDNRARRPSISVPLPHHPVQWIRAQSNVLIEEMRHHPPIVSSARRPAVIPESPLPRRQRRNRRKARPPAARSPAPVGPIPPEATPHCPACNSGSGSAGTAPSLLVEQTPELATRAHHIVAHVHPRRAPNPLSNPIHQRLPPQRRGSGSKAG